jgi:hypothetical protein
VGKPEHGEYGTDGFIRPQAAQCWRSIDGAPVCWSCGAAKTGHPIIIAQRPIPNRDHTNGKTDAGPPLQSTCRGRCGDPLRQTVGHNSLTEWKWTGSGLSAGPQTIYLSFKEIQNTAAGALPRVVRLVANDLLVIEGFLPKVVSFIKSNWQWLWTSILISLVGWL